MRGIEHALNHGVAGLKISFDAYVKQNFVAIIFAAWVVTVIRAVRKADHLASTKFESAWRFTPLTYTLELHQSI